MELTDEQKKETIKVYTLAELEAQAHLLRVREARKQPLINAFGAIEQPARAAMEEITKPALERMRALCYGPVKDVQDKELAMKKELMLVVEPARLAYDEECAPAIAAYNALIDPIKQKLFADCLAIHRGERDGDEMISIAEVEP